MASSAFTVETGSRTQVLDVTDRVAATIPEGATGACLVSVRHTTAGLCVNEPERRLLGDIERFLEAVVPDRVWAHDEIDDNADAHLRAAMIGNGVTVPVTAGELDLGTWQGVLLVECDGPRTRTVDCRVVSATTPQDCE